MQTATNGEPRLPSPVVKAFCVRALPLVTPSSDPVVRMMRAVIVMIMNVVMKTPMIATNPCSAGCWTFACA